MAPTRSKRRTSTSLRARASRAKTLPGRVGNAERSRDLLLESAKKLFARRGYEAATVREIAQDAGVNLSLVSYYFGGKDGLYRQVIEGYGQSRLTTMERIMLPANNADEMRVRLKMLVDEMITSGLREKDLTTIILREVDQGLPVAQEVFETTFHQTFNRMVEFFRHGQTRGFINQSLDPQIIAQIVHGFMVHLLRTDQVCKRFLNLSIQEKDFREKAIDTFLHFFEHGVMRDQPLLHGGGS